MTSWRDQRRR